MSATTYRKRYLALANLSSFLCRLSFFSLFIYVNFFFRSVSNVKKHSFDFLLCFPFLSHSVHLLFLFAKPKVIKLLSGPFLAPGKALLIAHYSEETGLQIGGLLEND